jgi:hypothetical protein
MNYKTKQEAIEAFTKAAGDDFIEFDGQNCNDYLDDDADECAGWQVGDRRCDCGNRRVSIEVGGDEKDGYYAFASAY